VKKQGRRWRSTPKADRSARDRAARIALQVGPVVGLAEVQEPGSIKACGGTGLGPMSEPRGGATPIGHFLTRLGVYTANPFAFLVLVVYGALWYVFKPETFEWHAVATLATWGMTLVIQRAEHRDTQAIHAKLDEILHALGDARNEITRMDEEEPEEIERRRQHMRKDD
jgi:low affinity Fe/Cu permease